VAVERLGTPHWNTSFTHKSCYRPGKIMNLNRNGKIARFPDALGGEGGWRVEDRPGVSIKRPCLRCSEHSPSRWKIPVVPCQPNVAPPSRLRSGELVFAAILNQLNCNRLVANRPKSKLIVPNPACSIV
jgi:hypothetical protein